MLMGSKRLAVLASVIGGAVYFSQNYTISGLQKLKIESINANPSANSEASMFGANSTGWSRPSVQTSTPTGPSSSNALQPLPPNAQSPNGIGAGFAFNGNQSGRMPSGAATGMSNTSGLLTGMNTPNMPIDMAAKNGMSSLPPTNTSGLSARNQSQIDAMLAAKERDSKSPLTKFLDTVKPPTVRIATFNLQLFGRHKIDNPFVMESLVKLLRQFDVVALQEICSKQQDILPILVERLNRSDRQFDYLIGPRVGRTDNKEQFAFIFDTATIETDRQQLYTVDDPEDLIHREPLVGWFRSKLVPAREAFTFTLVNVHLDAELEDREIRVLPELVRSIQRDGRDEDDVILLGDFGASDRQLSFLRSAAMNLALEGVPTSTRGTSMTDNIVMPLKATDEFNGRSGVIDFLRQLNLAIEEANQISDHLPVWAEFFANEGGQVGRVSK